jgi:2-polyprenyl-3-methyl-5-hydroxy-6-metoxy-1,4-benzoquinol methylase
MTSSLDNTASQAQSQSHAAEVARGERFQFGANWQRFLSVLNDDRIRQAERSLGKMLELESLAGKTFLDIGSGSGLFSLAARRLGAQVHSIDFDPQSVACTTELRRRYFANDPNWKIEEGSALDPEYMKSKGQFDIVYSWGVLHHTGQMWKGLTHADWAVKPGGLLFVAIYNDTGSQSRRWLAIKKKYCELPGFLKTPFAALVWLPQELKAMASAMARLKPGEYIRSWTQYDREGRGMNKWYDIIDWVGGYPYEFAKPEEIFDFYRARGYELTRMVCGNVGTGCGEFVFRKKS